MLFLPLSAYSKYVNESRLKVLAARDGAVQETIKAARQRLMKTSKGSTYQALVQKLFIQVPFPSHIHA